MDNPIVSPLFIYLLDIIPKFGFWFMILGLLVGSVFTYVYIFYKRLRINGVVVEEYPGYKKTPFDELDDDKKDEIISGVKWGRRIAIICLITFIIGTIMPTRDTMIKMYIAKQITPNVLRKVRNTTMDLRDTIKKDIIDIITAINTKDNEKGE